MRIYKRVSCTHCKKCKDLSIHEDKIKKDVCVSCGNAYNITQRNSDYYLDYVFEGRRFRERVGKRKSMAEKALAAVEVQIAEKRYLNVKKEQKVKFEDFAEEYLNLHCKLNNKSWERSDSNNLAILRRFFSGRYLREITVHLVEKFKEDRTKEGAAPATVNRQLATLKCLFNKAIAWKKFSGENPVCDVRLFKENNQRKRFLEKDEVTRLLANCQGHLKAIITIAVYTGMRKGEILGLKWRDVDINRGILCLEETKNGERREVPINEQIKQAIISVRKHPNSEYIFYKKDGSPLRDIRTIFQKALNKAGIEIKTGVDKLVFHSLRHTCGSHLSMAGIDSVTIGKILGHKDLKMTLRYSHASFAHKQKAVEILGKRLEDVRRPKQPDCLDNILTQESSVLA